MPFYSFQTGLQDLQFWLSNRNSATVNAFFMNLFPLIETLWPETTQKPIQRLLINFQPGGKWRNIFRQLFLYTQIHTMLYEKLSKQSGGLKYSSGLMKHMYVHTRLFFGFKEKMRGKTLLILIRKVVYLVIIASFLSVGYQGGGVVLKSFSPFLFLLRFRSKCLKLFSTLNLRLVLTQKTCR